MRTTVRVAAVVAASVVLAAALTLLIGSGDHPGPRPTPWTDARLAAALTQVSGLGHPVAPAEVAGILTRDCPFLPDPVRMVQQRGGTEGEVDAVMSVLAQSGRCN